MTKEELADINANALIHLLVTLGYNPAEALAVLALAMARIIFRQATEKTEARNDVVKALDMFIACEGRLSDLPALDVPSINGPGGSA